MKYDDIVMKKVAKEIKKLRNKGYTLLDVGASETHLKDLLPENVLYYSLDIKGKPDFKRDLDKPLKIRKRFDIIVCLETLEHTIKPNEVIKEIIKLGKKGCIFFFSMPNEYNFYCRINFLIGKKTSVQEPFKIAEKHLHIHQPRVKDIIKFYSEYFELKKVYYCWYSRSSEYGNRISKNVFRVIDKVLNVFSWVYPSLFSRNVLIMGKN